MQLHQEKNLINEIIRLQNFITNLYEESSYFVKQKIKKILKETPQEIKSIIDK